MDKTKITLAMPPEAAQKIAKDPQALIEYLRKEGFDVESVEVKPKPQSQTDAPA